MFVCMTFSDVMDVENDYIGEKRNPTKDTTNKRCYPKCMTPFRFSQPHKTRTEAEREADCSSGSTLYLYEKKGL